MPMSSIQSNEDIKIKLKNKLLKKETKASNTNQIDITISRISIMKKSEFKFLDDTRSSDDETIVVIKEYCLVGHKEILYEEQNDSDEEESEQDNDDSGIQAKDKLTCTEELASHKINSLVPKDSNKSWRITCLLCKKAIVKQFTNRLTNKTNSLLRLQFCDQSGYIEVVAFDENIKKIKGLCINTTYNISNGDIKSSPKNYRATSPHALLFGFFVRAVDVRQSAAFYNCYTPIPFVLWRDS